MAALRRHSRSPGLAPAGPWVVSSNKSPRSDKRWARLPARPAGAQSGCWLFVFPRLTPWATLCRPPPATQKRVV